MKKQSEGNNTTLTSVVLSMILLLISSCSSLNTEDLQNGVDKIAERFVPDQREGISDIRVVEGKNHELVIRGETDSPELKQAVIDTLKKSGYSIN